MHVSKSPVLALNNASNADCRPTEMRQRGLRVPDDCDALALTFAYPVQRRDTSDDWRLEEKLERLPACVIQADSCSSGPPASCRPHDHEPAGSRRSGRA